MQTFTRSIHLFLAPTVVLCMYLFAFWISPAPLYDDAYMFVRYADRLLSGAGFAWNPDGVQTYGATSIPYLLWVTLLRAILPVDQRTTLLIASGVCGALAILVMGVSIRRIFLRDGISAPILPWILVATILLPFPTLITVRSNPLDPTTQPHPAFTIGESMYVSNSVNGMDTSLAILVNALLISATVLSSRGANRRTFLFLGFVASLCVMVRPDNGIGAILFPILYLWRVALQARPVPIAFFLLGFSSLTVLDLAWKTIVFGLPLPLPFFAKTGAQYSDFVGLSTWNGLLLFQNFLSSMFWLLALAVTTITARTLGTALIFGVPILCFIVWSLISTVQIMGYFGRFYAPLIPFVVFGSALMLKEHLARRRGDAGSSRPGKIAWGAALSLVVTFTAWLIFSAGAVAHGKTLAERERMIRESSRDPWISPGTSVPYEWGEGALAVDELLRNLPAEITIAGTEIGYLSAAHPERFFIDMTGLNDSAFAREGFRVDTLLAKSPDLVWFPEFAYIGMRREIGNSPEFLERYEIFPSAFRYGLGVRRDTRFKNLIDQLVQGELQRVAGHPSPPKLD